jgi:hypothetical protein
MKAIQDSQDSQKPGYQIITSLVDQIILSQPEEKNISSYPC